MLTEARLSMCIAKREDEPLGNERKNFKYYWLKLYGCASLVKMAKSQNNETIHSYVKSFKSGKLPVDARYIEKEKTGCQFLIHPPSPQTISVTPLAMTLYIEEAPQIS